VGVAVQHEVGAVLQDRRREAVAAQEGPDLGRLAAKRVGDGGVVQQRDPERAQRDLVQARRQRLHLSGGLGIDRAQRRLAEVRQPQPAETAHESLRARDADAA